MMASILKKMNDGIYSKKMSMASWALGWPLGQLVAASLPRELQRQL
jgi:hypothetical protein